MGTKNVTVGVSVVSNRASTSRKNYGVISSTVDNSITETVAHLRDCSPIDVVKGKVVTGTERVLGEEDGGNVSVTAEEVRGTIAVRSEHS